VTPGKCRDRRRAITSSWPLKKNVSDNDLAKEVFLFLTGHNRARQRAWSGLAWRNRTDIQRESICYGDGYITRFPSCEERGKNSKECRRFQVSHKLRAVRSLLWPPWYHRLWPLLERKACTRQGMRGNRNQPADLAGIRPSSRSSSSLSSIWFWSLCSTHITDFNRVYYLFKVLWILITFLSRVILLSSHVSCSN
jgi:hypothetical protein